MNVNNNKPVALTPNHTIPVNNDFDIATAIKQTIIEPLFTPMVSNQPVTIKNNNVDVTEDDILNVIFQSSGENIDVSSEEFLKDLFGQTLIHFDKLTTLPIQELFAIQAACKEGLPAPSPSCIYTPNTDIIPSCREFLGGIGTYEKLFASFAYYARPKSHGIYFANDVAFNNFKTWFDSQMQPLLAVLPSNTVSMIHQFKQVDLTSLLECIAIRNNENENNEPFSFARIIMFYLMQYTNVANPNEYGIFPFRIDELFCPHRITFVNLEQHAKSSAKAISKAWKELDQITRTNITIASNKQLKRLSAISRNLNRMQSNKTSHKKDNQIQRAKQSIRFSNKRPTDKTLLRNIELVISKMADVSRSENIYKQYRPSFARPNRRNPDDYNLRGKAVATRYRPDIHLYLDTSGSISEENYQDMVKICIMLAKKLNVNLYFNSFSHVLSECTKLELKDKTISDCYKTFQKVPKVTGGTNFSLVWEYIQQSKKRRKELSLLITDFEYTAPNKRNDHPKNLYYAPCSSFEWSQLKSEAEYFCKSLLGSKPDIRKHLLF